MALKIKTIKITLITLGCLILFLLIGTRINKVPCVPEIPERIGEVSLSARWIGGCDGGFWFDVLGMNRDSNKYRISIYYDYNGKLISEKYFYLKDACLEAYKNEEDVYSAILDYDFNIILTRDVNCYIYPVDNKTE